MRWNTNINRTSSVKPPLGERDHKHLGGHAEDRFDKHDFGEDGGRKFKGVPYHLRPALKVKVEGKGILMDPAYNKGAAFPLGERDRLGIRGLLPPSTFFFELDFHKFTSLQSIRIYFLLIHTLTLS